MLKSIKRLTAIVLSFTVLFGTHGYAVGDNQNDIELNSSENVSVRVEVNEDSTEDNDDDDTYKKTVASWQQGPAEQNASVITDLNKDIITLSHAAAKAGITSVKIDPNKICSSDNHGQIRLPAGESGANEIIDSHAFVSSLSNFFLFFPIDNLSSELERRSKLHEKITDFYSLADVTAIDIENGSSDCYCCKCYCCNCSPGCKLCCCGTFRLAPYAILCVCGLAAFIVSIVYFLKDGIIDATEGTLIGIGVVAALGAMVMGFANLEKPLRACANGCGCCCANYNFLDTKNDNHGRVGDGSVTPTKYDYGNLGMLKRNLENWLEFDEAGKVAFNDIRNWINPKNLLAFVKNKKTNKYILLLTPYLKNDNYLIPKLSSRDIDEINEGIKDLRRYSFGSHDFVNKFEELRDNIVNKIIEINNITYDNHVGDIEIIVNNLLCFIYAIPYPAGWFS